MVKLDGFQVVSYELECCWILFVEESAYSREVCLCQYSWVSWISQCIAHKRFWSVILVWYFLTLHDAHALDEGLDVYVHGKATLCRNISGPRGLLVPDDTYKSYPALYGSALTPQRVFEPFKPPNTYCFTTHYDTYEIFCNHCLHQIHTLCLDKALISIFLTVNLLIALARLTARALHLHRLWKWYSRRSLAHSMF